MVGQLSSLPCTSRGTPIESWQRTASHPSWRVLFRELSPQLGHQHQTRGQDALAASLRAAPTNLSRAQLMAEALTREDSLSLGGPSDAAAVDRMRELLARPHEVIRDVEDHAVSTLRRLYRQRNLVMHGGLVNAVALQATLRTAAPIVGAGVDRVAHAHMVQKIHPLDLAVRARLQIDLLSSNSSTGPLTLLE